MAGKKVKQKLKKIFEGKTKIVTTAEKFKTNFSAVVRLIRIRTLKYRRFILIKVTKYKLLLKSSKKARLLTASSLLIFGVVLIILILALLKPETKSDRKVEPVSFALADVITYSTENPDVVPPADDYNWVGQANDPKQIKMPSIGVDGFIQKVGVDQNTQIAVPNNVHMVGWFVNSAIPGANGLSIIDGHVDSPVGAGIFRNLDKLKEGDTFSITLGDDSIKSYKVMTVQSVPVEEAANYLFSQDSKVKSQLNLITCIGTYLQDQKTYDQRVIVSAELI